MHEHCTSLPRMPFKNTSFKLHLSEKLKLIIFGNNKKNLYMQYAACPWKSSCNEDYNNGKINWHNLFFFPSHTLIIYVIMLNVQHTKRNYSSCKPSECKTKHLLLRHGFIVFNKKQEFIFVLGLEMIYPFRSRKVKWWILRIITFFLFPWSKMSSS